MERESLEEGLITSSLLHGPKPGSVMFRGDSSVTALLVLSTVVAVSGTFSYGCAVGYSSPVEVGIMEDLGLSVAAYSLFGSMQTIGGLLGAILSGRISDLIGRKRTMCFSEVILTSGWLAITFAKDAWWLDIGRLLTGFGVGIATYVVPVYIAEIAPKDLRGRLILTNELMVTSGCAFVYFVGTITSWRTLALISAIPSIAQIVGLLFIPESPRWMAKSGQEKEFEAALQHLRGKTTDISAEAADIRTHMEGFQQQTEGGFRDLFQRRYVNSLIVGFGLMSFQQLGGATALVYYASSIFEEAGFSSSMGSKILAIIKIPVAVLGLLLMDKSGRRPLLLASAAGMSLSCFLIGISFYFQDELHMKEFTPIMALVGLLGASTTLTLGMAGIPWVIVSEIFPINVKGAAGSICGLISHLCALVVSYSFNFIFQWSSTGTFFIFSVICGANVIFVAKMVPETKGRTLEEIQTSTIRSP